jgi:hypothetical protein
MCLSLIRESLVPLWFLSFFLTLYHFAGFLNLRRLETVYNTRPFSAMVPMARYSRTWFPHPPDCRHLISRPRFNFHQSRSSALDAYVWITDE